MTTVMKWTLATIVACATPDIAAMAVTVSATNGGGPTPQQLANSIADTTSGVTVVAASATTVINDGSSTLGSSRSMGSFANGLTAPGTQLPAANGGSPTVTYAGGLGVASGVCLCTGLVTDSDGNDGNPAPTGRGVGVEGPNNGYGDNNDGEISKIILGSAVIDADFQEAVFTSQGETMPSSSGDPVVLQFDVQITSPGFLSVKTVFGSDEYPRYINEPYNDAFAILVKNECADYENIAVLIDGGMRKPFSLQAVEDCEEPQFLLNQVAPKPTALIASDHAIKDGMGQYDPLVSRYDHEFGGFTALRTWETKCPLAPGVYTVKFVIHDVSDAKVDSALFIQQDSLKLFSFLPADFDLNGVIDGADFLIYQRNFGRFGDAKFVDGDANGDCDVTSADAIILINNWGAAGGNGNFRADFDRDGDVDSADLAIWSANFGLMHCASRFEGDADGDGDVDGSDFLIWQQGAGGATVPAGCGGEEQMAIAAVGDQTPQPDYGELDLDEDGELSLEEAKAWLSAQGIVP